MFEIKIYGEITHISDKSEKTVDLSDLQSQLLKAEGQDVKVRLNCDGGDFEEGFAMYYELRRYAKENNAIVHTFAEGRLKSMATVIFLAGDVRELSTGLQPFVHEVSRADGKEPTEEQITYMQQLNIRIANHYASHTDITVDEALEMMANDTYISTDLAKEMRFATNIENVFVPVALKRFNINKNEDKMNKKTQTLLNKAMNFLKGFQNKLVATADGTELDFYELEDEAVVEVGAKATFDGADAQGDYVMSTGETFTFEAGELTKITPAEEEMTIEDAKAEIEALHSQLEAVTNKAVELDVQNKANIALIANFKASSKVIPLVAKVAPKKVEILEATSASKAVANFNKFKTK